MKVEVAVLTPQSSIAADGVTATIAMAITDRVQLACEVVETINALSTRVRLLEAGAGMAIGDELIVHPAKLSS